MRRRIIAAFVIFSTLFTAISPAHAIFGIGDIVLDPSNLAQNILTASRSLRQISNQVRQLQNEARMLINDAKDLVSLDFDIGGELGQVLGEIAYLTNQARAISYQVEETKRIFETYYPEEYTDWSGTEIAELSATQWQISRSAFQDTLLIQSKIVESVHDDTGLLTDLIAKSQSATGNLSVMQAGNQIMALDAKQTMQLQEMLATQYRAESLERTRIIAAQEQAEVQHVRFVGVASAYGTR